MKHVKLGFGHTTEFSSYDVRTGRISRSEAVQLIREFDGRCHPRFIKGYCDWIGITTDEFDRVRNSFRGSMWSQSKNGQWQIDSPIWKEQPVFEIEKINEIVNRLNAERIALSIETLAVRPILVNEIVSL
jgi:hypothetical protein